MAKKNTDKVVFHQIKVIDAGAGVSVAKALMAKCVYTKRSSW
jgi:23S rRNA (uracil1939-C5)-methyltransferase